MLQSPGQSGNEPDIHPDVRSMEALAHRLESGALADQLVRARTIIRMDQVPPDAILQVEAEPSDGSLAVEILQFRRSPAPEIGEAEWLLIREGKPTLPVVLHGACLGDGRISEPGSIKAGADFGFYSVTTFRSREATVVDGKPLSPLPTPETIDPFILSVCRGMGMVTESMNGELVWQLPETYFQTGPVLDALWSQPGARAGDAAEN
jgi:hypothetical protein